MGIGWYYRRGEDVVGPVTARELRQLMGRGEIGKSGLVRRGEVGEWLEAGRLVELLPHADTADCPPDCYALEGEPLPDSVPAPSPDSSEWDFTTGGRRYGPVTLAALRKLAASGRLGAEDLVRPSGAGAWGPARRVAGLFLAPLAADPPPESQAGAPAPTPVVGCVDRPDVMTSPAPNRTVLVVAAGSLALALVAVTIAVLAARRVPGPAGSRPVRIASDAAAHPTLAPPGPDPGPITPREALAPAAVAPPPPVIVAPRGDVVAPPPPAAPAAQAPAIDAENSLAAAEAAIRESRWGEVVPRLDRYLGEPGARDRPRAIELRRQFLVAVSNDAAEQLARSLSDLELEHHLRDGGRRLAALAEISTPELLAVYQARVARAMQDEWQRRLRQLSARGPSVPQPAGILPWALHAGAGRGPAGRRAVPPQPRGGMAAAPAPRLVAPGGPPVADARALDRRPDPIFDDESLARASIDRVLESPESFAGQTILLDGLFRIGSRILDLKEPDGQVVGPSILIARDDGRTISTGEKAVVGHDSYLVLDGRLAIVLTRAFAQLGIRPSVRPAFRSIVVVRPGEIVQGKRTIRTLVVTSLEILGACNFILAADRRFENAFRVVHVSASGGEARHGDGARWAERLGGETKFVQPLRRKLRDIQGHMAANRQQAAFNYIYQQALAANTDLANAQQRQLASSVSGFQQGLGIMALEGGFWSRRFP